MVAQPIIERSLAHLPTHLTAVFVGATSGIGEYTLKSFAKHCPHPKAYFIGRSPTAGARILSELKAQNPAGQYTFIPSDISLLKNVDAVCQQIKEKEQHINMLVLSQGTMVQGVDTPEGLHLPASLILHSRARFIANLLPELRRAPTLRRVLSIFTGTKEGPIVNPDLQMRNAGVSVLKLRGQAASVMTMYLSHFAKLAPDVSFVHDFPGPVRSNIAREGGVAMTVMRVLFKALGPFVFIPDGVSGDRHLFLATSARYRAVVGGCDGVDAQGEIAKAIDGELGSGCYVVDQVCESGDAEVVEVLKKVRDEGWDEKVWKHLQEEFLRITGKESL
ncbi:hypothetical protein EJ04DRAFT_547263 [Polyplosphaeria fusca]|uniref:Uncharacterized protein n=1 Tax=Polyplosphaeria fusca TaxID=682080 RepID=A0A9P4UWQ5_9PLEO|nr:hypothetical protein EJ04DRAFT_547263 [Polyplosphaeria fusca]